MTRLAQAQFVFWLSAAVTIIAAVGCGRDGYVVVKESKTPHRAFDLPTFNGTRKAPETPPAPIIPIEAPELVAVPPLAPNLLPLKGQRAAKPGAGSAVLSVTFSDRTGDRTSKFTEGTVKDCAIFKAKGEEAGQKMFLYAHLQNAARSLRMGLDVTLYEGQLPPIDAARLSNFDLWSLASWTLRPVLRGRSILEAKDNDVDAEGPPMWAMDTSLTQAKLDASCRASATVRRDGGAPKISMGLSCGKIAGDASTAEILSLDTSVECDARETNRTPYFAGESK